MLLNLTLHLGYLLLKLLNCFFLSGPEALELFLLLFFLLTEGFILTDVVLEVHTIVVELLLAIDERLLTTLLLLFKLFDFLLNSVICELGQEHLLLLLDELIGVLSTILLRELDTASCDVHGLVNVTLLL